MDGEVQQQIATFLDVNRVSGLIYFLLVHAATSCVVQALSLSAHCISRGASRITDSQFRLSCISSYVYFHPGVVVLQHSVESFKYNDAEHTWSLAAARLNSLDRPG